MTTQHTAVQPLPLVVGAGAVIANTYLAQFVLPGLTIVMAIAFFAFILLNIWEDMRRKSAWLVKCIFTIEAAGGLVYAICHTGSVAHWIFEEGTTSHLFIFLALAITIPLVDYALLQGPLPHREVNPG